MKKITKTKSVQRLEKPTKQVVRIIKLPNKGDNGYTPVKDKDYFDGKDGYTPQKGIDYNDGENGINGYTPVKGVDYFDGKDGKNGENGKSIPKSEVKKMVDESIKKALPKLMPELEGKGNVVVEGADEGYNLVIDGKKHFVPNAVYAPKLRNFIQLGDSPGTYAGAAGKFLSVNSTETGIEYITGGGGAVDSVNGQTGVVVLDAGDISGFATVATTGSYNDLSDKPTIPTGTIDGTLTTNELVYSVDSNTVGSLAVATYPSLAELAYVKGVTSAIQTQLNGKEPTKGADDNYVTDAQLVVIGNTSGTNTGNQTITNSSDATSHTVTLSASGGSVQLIEGSNITLTTGGTGSAGTVTIASTGGGGGDVSKVGTPVNNQIGVWTGDGTIEGDAALTFDTTTDTMTIGAAGASSLIVAPDGTGSGNGGGLTIRTGAGGGTAGNGGDLYLEGGIGTAGNGDGGNIYIIAGEKNGSGGNGIVALQGGGYTSNNGVHIFGTAADAIFDTSLLATGAKTFTFPNTTGTFALTANKLSAFAATTSSELAGVISDETGTGALVFATSPTLVTPALGTPSSGTLTNCTGLPAAGVVNTAMTLSASQTVTGQKQFNNFIDVNNAIAASGNAATVPVTFRLNTVTNNSAATLTITMTTASAVDGQMTMVRILDFSAATQTITWVNTENSTVSAPTTSNGSTTLFLTVGFIYNSATSKWRCIASA